MNTGVLSAKGVCKSYGDNQVLQDLDLDIQPGKIYGLIGRNGAGKTTLLSILTAQNTMDSGEVTYNGKSVWENQDALNHICFSRELQPTLFTGPNNLKIKYYLNTASIFYPNWDQEYAQRLLQEFKLNPKKKISQLSKGQMSMVTILLALASGADITILDEPVAGLDVVMRERFYQLLLDDYAKTNRTLLSPPTSSRRPPPSLSGSSSWTRGRSLRTPRPTSWSMSSATSPATRRRWTGPARAWRCSPPGRPAATRAAACGAARPSWPRRRSSTWISPP